jgi:type IV secretion system protein VirD4
MSSSSHNEQYRFGSASWAQEHQVAEAGLFRRAGPQIGYWEQNPLFLDSDAPILTIGGAGSGKLRDLLGYVTCNTPGQRMIVLDPRGEHSAVSQVAHAIHGEHAFTWDPLGLRGLPQHRCNLLDLIDPQSPFFHADCKLVAQSLFAATSTGDGKYFELRAGNVIEAFLKHDAAMNGWTSLPRLMAIVNMVESGDKGWPSFIETMLASPFPDIRRTAGEMLAKQQDSPREFGSIMGEIYGGLSFLDDPALQRALGHSDFSLSALIDPTRVCKIFLIVPAEYLKIFAPVLRLFFTVTMILKGRAPSAARVLMLVDEAGQLGSFDALLQSFTYGRGMGIRSWAIFQDAGQISRNYGPAGLSGFMGSAQMRQFFGVRDYQTAQAISNMLGSETLEYDDTRLQEAARRQKVQAMQRFMMGEDPFGAAFDAAHYARTEKLRTKQARKLMTEDEILSMPEDRQILFIAGKNIPPLYAHKYPYYTRPEMAGLYLPNPYHPPYDKVPIAGGWRTKWARVIREPVPKKFESFPQFQNGTWAYVEGYKPT